MVVAPFEEAISGAEAHEEVAFGGDIVVADDVGIAVADAATEVNLGRLWQTVAGDIILSVKPLAIAVVVGFGGHVVPHKLGDITALVSGCPSEMACLMIAILERIHQSFWWYSLTSLTMLAWLGK